MTFIKAFEHLIPTFANAKLVTQYGNMKLK